MLNKPKTSWRKLTLERLEDRSMLSCSVPNADFNSSGLVDATDLGVWQIGYGTGIAHNQGDADGDADVDGRDFLAWQRQYGQPAPPDQFIVTTMGLKPSPSGETFRFYFDDVYPFEIRSTS